jgi:hypothetical protein
MRGDSFPTIFRAAIFVVLLLAAGYVVAQDKKSEKSICASPNPEKLCSAANTCGVNGSPCVLEVKRADGGTGASVTSSLRDIPKDSVICIKAGASVTWKGAGKNTGIVVDFGDSSPFDRPGTIMGGSDRPVTVVAKKPGCYKYTVGACTPGSIYGMCGNSDLELVVTP